MVFGASQKKNLEIFRGTKSPIKDHLREGKNKREKAIKNKEQKQICK